MNVSIKEGFTGRLLIRPQTLHKFKEAARKKGMVMSRMADSLIDKEAEKILSKNASELTHTIKVAEAEAWVDRNIMQLRNVMDIKKEYIAAKGRAAEEVAR